MGTSNSQFPSKKLQTQPFSPSKKKFSDICSVYAMAAVVAKAFFNFFFYNIFYTNNSTACPITLFYFANRKIRQEEKKIANVHIKHSLNRKYSMQQIFRNRLRSITTTTMITMRLAPFPFSYSTSMLNFHNQCNPLLVTVACLFFNST